MEGNSGTTGSGRLSRKQLEEEMALLQAENEELASTVSALTVASDAAAPRRSDRWVRRWLAVGG